MADYLYNGNALTSLKTDHWRGIQSLKFSQRGDKFEYLINDHSFALLTEYKEPIPGYNNDPYFSIVDLPRKGCGTFLFNTWIVMAKTFFHEQDAISVTGTLHHPDKEDTSDIQNRKRFWKQFGFELDGEYMEARLSDLEPIAHRQGGTFYAHPHEFASENGQNLYYDGLMHKFSSRS